MSRRTDVRGESFEEALASAVAELLDCDADDVDLQLDAPGLSDLAGRFRLEFEVVDDEADEDADTGDRGRADDEPSGAGPESEESDSDVDVDEESDEDSDDDRDERAGGDGSGGREQVTIEDLDEEADAAADFLEGLLDALDLPGDLRIKTHDDHAEVEVLDIGSGALIGRRGQTLEAIQELVRCALQREFQRRSRVKIDAEGYRARRLEKLLEKAEEAIDDVLDTGEPQRLEPMDVFERKAIHHLVAEYDGVNSRSQGREPARRVIIEAD